MKAKIRAAIGSLVVGGVLAGTAVMPATGQAAQPGQVCHVHSIYSWMPVSNLTTGVIMYWVPSGGGFRITAYGDPSTYVGHGNGLQDGLVYRWYIDQASCHW